MFLYEAFPPELIKIGLESEDKDEVFEEMVDLLCRVKKIDCREEMLEALWKRESKMSTGIMKGIAIPHGKMADLDEILGVIGISKKGVEYEALDGSPVHVLFMLLIPQSDEENHLRLLKRLAELLGNHHFFTELFAQDNPQNVSGIIKKFEDIYITSE
jgi:PTS system fructose-specific IIC component/PTS system nitrogen regulatory IIA component